MDLSVGCVWSNGRAYYAPWAAIWGAVGARWIVMALKAADQKSESFAKDVLSEYDKVIAQGDGAAAISDAAGAGSAFV